MTDFSVRLSPDLAATKPNAITLPPIEGMKGTKQSPAPPRDFASFSTAAPTFQSVAEDEHDSQGDSGMTSDDFCCDDMRPARLEPMSPVTSFQSPVLRPAAPRSAAPRAQDVSPRRRIAARHSGSSQESAAPQPRAPAGSSPRRARPTIAARTAIVPAPPACAPPHNSSPRNLRGNLASRPCVYTAVEASATPARCEAPVPTTHRRLRSIAALSLSRQVHQARSSFDSILARKEQDTDHRQKIRHHDRDIERELAAIDEDIVLNSQEFVPKRIVKNVKESKAKVVAVELLAAAVGLSRAILRLR